MSNLAEFTDISGVSFMINVSHIAKVVPVKVVRNKVKYDCTEIYTFDGMVYCVDTDYQATRRHIFENM